MERKRISSSKIRAVGYDPKGEVLEVEFSDGRVVAYSGVSNGGPPALHERPLPGELLRRQDRRRVSRPAAALGAPSRTDETHAMNGFAERRERLVAELGAAPGGAALRLDKTTSNLFRDREAAPRQRLDVRAFSHVLEVDPAGGWVDVEGMTPYAALADATLARGVMPCVVPQLKSITIGGAVAGIGIEASSFKLRPRPRDDARARGADRRRRGRRGPTRQRAPRSLPRLPQFLRHARLCAAREGEDRAGEAVRAHRARPPRRPGELLRQPRRGLRLGASTSSTGSCSGRASW